MYQCNLLVMEIALRWVCISDFSVLNPYKGSYFGPAVAARGLCQKWIARARLAGNLRRHEEP